MGEQIRLTVDEAAKLNLLLDMIRPERRMASEPGQSAATDCHSDESGANEQVAPGAPLPVWLDIKQACEYIHVSRSKLYSLIKEGKIPAMKVSRKLLIRRERLDELIESGSLA
ncbi:helix-turn-helix domain-containing protein [Adlercreutzia sp. ZJ141]|uniref:helix-turn-helix domain-containing protein n=1 Tax=Adlercreutzia sp. ZJ141 TaxID=2709406 RepID=UPI0013EC00C1|nr:helix-turn-helix domain-containing protein [Adlercreutzia sp. ZJ141]